MSTIRKFEKPLGMRDTLPRIFEQQNEIRTKAMSYIEKHGYDFIQTPSLEYFETIGKISSLEESSLFKLVDNQGEMLVLRPDLTTPIARVAASKLLKEKNPLRLAYSSTVFRAQQQEGGRPAEFEQLGLELLGDSSAIADSEILRLAAGLLNELGVTSYKITVGHSAFIDQAIASLIEEEEQQTVVRTFLVDRNFVGIDTWAKQYPASGLFMSFFKQAMQGLTIKELVEGFPKLQTTASAQFIDLIEAAEQMDELKSHIQIDPLLVSHMHYYTGMVFEIFSEGSGFPLGNGGRYDGLVSQFGIEVGATGFSVRMERLLEVIPKQPTRKIKRLLYIEKNTFLAGAKQAELYRMDGELVTLQVKSSVKDLAIFEQNFDFISDMTEGGN